MKKIWILNHYAISMYFNQGGRHYWFAKNLIKNNYLPFVFCANRRHGNDQIINVNKKKFEIKESNQIPFVFIKTSKYQGNGLNRIKNMVTFFKNLFSVTKKVENILGKPDIILASSVHPLTCVAGLFISKRYKIPCIVEIRDLWPLTLVAMGALKEHNIITKLLYHGEHWIYQKAGAIIFTMEGGKDYLIDRGWNDINSSKVHYINNGIDLNEFNRSKQSNTFEDTHLDDPKLFKVIYSGSIRPANDVKRVVETAENFFKKGYKDIVFLIYGDGIQRQELEDYCKQRNLSNVIFKGRIEKKYVPFVLSKGSCNLLNYKEDMSVFKYGGSQNKLFEYFASGKPVIETIKLNYDLVNKYKCGVIVGEEGTNSIEDAILKIYHMPQNEYDQYCQNAKRAAEDFDFGVLTDKLIEIIKSQGVENQNENTTH